MMRVFPLRWGGRLAWLMVLLLSLSLAGALAGCVLPGGGDAGGTGGTGDTSGTGDTGGSVSTATLRGVLVGVGGASALSEGGGAGEALVIAEDTATGKTFSGLTEPDGSFSVSVPAASGLKALGLEGGTYIISIVSGTGKPVGTITYGPSARGDAGETVTGLRAEGEVDLGSVSVPADTSTEPIVADEVDSSAVDPAVTARTDAAGVPVGMDTYGKGDAAGVAAGGLAAENAADVDRDGIPSSLDADDDGDGVADDFDSDANGDGIPDDDPQQLSEVDVRVGFLLDIRSAFGVKQYIDDATRDAALVRDMALDFLILRPADQPGSGADWWDQISSVRLVTDTAPAYYDKLQVVETNSVTLADGTTQAVGNPSDWSGIGYELPRNLTDNVGYRLRVRLASTATAADLFEVGDTFTFTISYTDGTEETYTRMLNYTFQTVTYFAAWAFGGDTAPTDDTEFTPIDFTQYTSDQDAVALTAPAGATTLWFKIVPPLDDRGEPIYEGASFRFEVRPPATARDWDEGGTSTDGSHRYDGMLEDFPLKSDADGTAYVIAGIPVRYLGNGVYNIEYFLGIQESYIKNRLDFDISGL